MRKEKRRQILILQDILFSITELHHVTRIMSLTNLSYSQLMTYIKLLKTAGLITELKSQNQIKFRLSEKGFSFLGLFSRKQSMPFEQNLENEVKD